MSGNAGTGHWIRVDPFKYDEPAEIGIEGFEPGTFMSPYDLPDDVRRASKGRVTKR